jgi:hypothetical protein
MKDAMSASVRDDVDSVEEKKTNSIEDKQPRTLEEIDLPDRLKLIDLERMLEKQGEERKIISKWIKEQVLDMVYPDLFRQFVRMKIKYYKLNFKDLPGFVNVHFRKFERRMKRFRVRLESFLVKNNLLLRWSQSCSLDDI